MKVRNNKNRLPSRISALYSQKNNFKPSETERDTIAQSHNLTVTAKQHVGCANQLRSRKFSYFQRNDPPLPCMCSECIYMEMK